MERTTRTYTSDNADRGAWQALSVWDIFIVLLVIVNATIPLLASDNAALAFLVRRDLVGEEGHPLELLWHLPQVEGWLRKQHSNGA